MKKDICGIEVIVSNCSLSPKNVEESCICAESLVEKIRNTTGYEPLKDLEKITVQKLSQKTETKKLIVHFNNLKTNQFEKKEIISCNYTSKGGLYGGGSIDFDAGQFYPLHKGIFSHEIGHNIHEHLPWGKRLEIKGKYSALKKELIKKIRNGANPNDTAEDMIEAYAFLHEFEFSKGDQICFEGYIGILNRIVQILPKDSPQMAIQAYALHKNENEFFAVMFSMYFQERKKLKEKGLLDFAEKIIQK